MRRGEVMPPLEEIPSYLTLKKRGERGLSGEEKRNPHFRRDHEEERREELKKIATARKKIYGGKKGTLGLKYSTRKKA